MVTRGYPSGVVPFTVIFHCVQGDPGAAERKMGPADCAPAAVHVRFEYPRNSAHAQKAEMLNILEGWQ